MSSLARERKVLKQSSCYNHVTKQLHEKLEAEGSTELGGCSTKCRAVRSTLVKITLVSLGLPFRTPSHQTASFIKLDIMATKSMRSSRQILKRSVTAFAATRDPLLVSVIP